MFRFTNLLLPCAAALALVACGGRNLTISEVAGGFSMQAPAGWIAGDADRLHATHYWLDDQAEDGAASDIAVRQFRFRGDTGSLHVSRAISTLLEGKLRDYEMVTFGSATIAGQDATWLLSRYKTDNCSVEMLHYYVPFGETMLEVSCSCLDGTMSSMRPVFEAAVASIVVN